jgi:hypothetical protein
LSTSRGDLITQNGLNERSQARRNPAEPNGALEPAAESMAQGIADYRVAPFSGVAANRRDNQAIMARARMLNPNYDANNYAAAQRITFGRASDGPQTTPFRPSTWFRSIIMGNRLDRLSRLMSAIRAGTTFMLSASIFQIPGMRL